MEEPLLEIEDGFKGISSLESECKKFTIGYTTFRNTEDPYTPIFRCCDELKQRLNNILHDWENDINDRIHTRQEENIYIIEIEGEKWTIANLISYYIYSEMPSIEFVTSSVVHIEKNIGVIKIGNKNYKKLFTNAIKRVLIDIEIIRKAF
jgi:DNA-directed RNA polymerase subunit L